MTVEKSQEDIDQVSTSQESISEIATKLNHISVNLNSSEIMTHEKLLQIGNELVELHEEISKMQTDEEMSVLQNKLQRLIIININLSVIAWNRSISSKSEVEKSNENLQVQQAQWLLMSIGELALYDLTIETITEQHNNLNELHNIFLALDHNLSDRIELMPDDIRTNFRAFKEALENLRYVFQTIEQFLSETKKTKEYNALKDFQPIENSLKQLQNRELQLNLQSLNLNEEFTKYLKELNEFIPTLQKDEESLHRIVKPILNNFINTTLARIKNSLAALQVFELALQRLEQFLPNEQLVNSSEALLAIENKSKILKKALKDAELFCSLFLSMEKKLTINDFLKLTEGNSQLSGLTYSYQDQQLGLQQPSYCTTSPSSFFSSPNQQALGTQPQSNKRPRSFHDPRALSEILQPPTPKSTQSSPSSNKESDLTPKPPGNR